MRSPQASPLHSGRFGAQGLPPSRVGRGQRLPVAHAQPLNKEQSHRSLAPAGAGKIPRSAEREKPCRRRPLTPLVDRHCARLIALYALIRYRRARPRKMYFLRNFDGGPQPPKVDAKRTFCAIKGAKHKRPPTASWTLLPFIPPFKFYIKIKSKRRVRDSRAAEPKPWRRSTSHVSGRL